MKLFFFVSNILAFILTIGNEKYYSLKIPGSENELHSIPMVDYGDVKKSRKICRITNTQFLCKKFHCQYDKETKTCY